MCGRYNVSNSSATRQLVEDLGLQLELDDRRNISPGARGQFILERKGQREVLDGLWSLLVEARPGGNGYRPDPRFKTFNARSYRLSASPLWRGRVTRKRSIIPATAWHEWLGKQCYLITPASGAIAFGGLYELWEFGEDVVPAFSIITLPPHPRIRHIHDKSLPLMLRRQDFDAWLDPSLTTPDVFADLLQPRLNEEFSIIPIDSPQGLHPVGPEEIVPAD